MSEDREAVRSAAIRFVESLSSLDPDTIGPLMTDDAIFETMFCSKGMPLTRNRTRAEFLEQLPGQKETLFPNGLSLVITGTTVEGDRVALESESRALAGNGNEYSNLYHWLIRVRDGKVAHAREYCDFLHAKEALF